MKLLVADLNRSGDTNLNAINNLISKAVWHTKKSFFKAIDCFRWIMRKYFHAIIIMLIISFNAASKPAFSSVKMLSTTVGIGTGQSGVLTGFNPLVTTTEAAASIESLLYYPLIYVDKNGHIDFKKSIASEVKVSKSQLTYTITMHKGWMWSNGDEVTARDVLNCFNEIKELGALFPNEGLAGIPGNIYGLNIISNHKFVVQLKKRINPMVFELNGLTLLFPMYNIGRSIKDIVNNVANIKYFRVVDGPYKISKYRPGRYLILTRNTKFSGARKPLIKTIIMHMISGNIIKVMQIISGRLDIGNVSVYDVGAVKYDNNISLSIKKNGFHGFNFIAFNYNNKKLSFLKDWRVRSALQQSINQAEIIKAVFRGFGMPMYGVMTPEDRGLLDAQVLPYDNVYDPVHARILLRRAGWVSRNGVQTRNGEKLIINLLCPDKKVDVAEAEMIQEQLHRIGVIIIIHVVPPSLIVESVRTHKWQAAIMSFATNNIPNVGILLDKSGRFNFSGYRSTYLDGVFKKIDSSKNNDALKYNMSIMNNFIEKEQPFLILPHPSVILAYKKYIFGINEAFPTEGGFWPQNLTINRVS